MSHIRTAVSKYLREIEELHSKCSKIESKIKTLQLQCKHHNITKPITDDVFTNFCVCKDCNI